MIRAIDIRDADAATRDCESFFIIDLLAEAYSKVAVFDRRIRIA